MSAQQLTIVILCGISAFFILATAFLYTDLQHEKELVRIWRESWEQAMKGWLESTGCTSHVRPRQQATDPVHRPS